MMQDDFEERRQHNCAILSTLQEFHKKEKYCDIRVQAGAKVFKCHRAILAANFEYFDSMMISSDNSEESRLEAIILPDDVDAAVFETLLHFMYSGEILVQNSNVVQLLVLNDKLGVSNYHLKERMVQFVRSRSEESKPMSCAISLLHYACDMGDDELVDISSAHVYRHVYHFSEDAQLMDETSFQHLKALLERSKNYIVPLPGSNDVLLKIVHNWVNYDREVRSQYRPKLMENVDFTLVSSDLTLSLMNTLANVVDEVSNVSSEDKSFPKLKTLGAALEGVLLGTSYGLGGTISWKVPHISELSIGEERSSPSIMISSLKWEIRIERCTSDELGLYLGCEGTDLASEWNIYANAAFTMKSNKEEGKYFVRYLSTKLISSDDDIWMMGSFLPWNVLIDPENGYIADDGSLPLKAHMFVGVPFLSYNPQ